MKKYILAIFTVLLSTIVFTGCGHSGSDSTGALPTSMTSVSVRLSQGSPDSIALYTSDALMKEGYNTTTFQVRGSRASFVSTKVEGVYEPVSDNGNGEYTFNVPTGQYTLMAVKGDSKAVMPVRAAADSGAAPIDAELTPVGKVTGSALTSDGIKEGIFVYLKNTSFVAITDQDGKFTLTGVPSCTPYTICATYNLYGKVYSSVEKTVTVPSEGLSVDSGIINLTETDKNSYKIKGKITSNGFDNLEKQVVFLSGRDTINHTINKFALTDKEGNFSFAVNVYGNYTVSLLGNEYYYQSSAQNFSINSSENLKVLADFKIVDVNTIASLIVTLNLVEPRDGTGVVPPFENNVKDVIVRLIGSGTTLYSTMEETIWNYDSYTAKVEFVDVPVGTYSLLVDPAESGLFGYSKLFYVKPGLNNQSVDNVEYLKPNLASVTIENKLDVDFGSLSNNLLDKDKAGEKIKLSLGLEKDSSETVYGITGEVKSDTGKEFLHFNASEFLSKIDGYANIVIGLSVPWSDPISGKNGMVRAETLKEYCSLTPITSLGTMNGDPYKPSLMTGFGNGKYFAYEGSNMIAFPKIPEIPGISKLEGKAILGCNGSDTVVVNGGNIELLSGDFKKTAPGSITPISASFLNNILTVTYRYPTDSSYPFDYKTYIYTKNGTVYNEVELDKSFGGYLFSEGADTRICVINKSEGKAKIKIGKVDEIESVEGISTNLLCKDVSFIKKFTPLGNGSYIVEVGKGEESLGRYVFLVAGGSAQEIIVERKDFCVDKYGYCYSAAGEKILKTTSFTGKPVAEFYDASLSNKSVVNPEDPESSVVLSLCDCGIIGYNPESDSLYVYYCYNNPISPDYSSYEIYKVPVSYFKACK